MRCIKRQGELNSLYGMLVPHPRQFACTQSYSWAERERGTVSVECVARQPDTVNRPGLEPGPLEAESSALRIRLLRVGSGAAFFKTL